MASLKHTIDIDYYDSEPRSIVHGPFYNTDWTCTYCDEDCHHMIETMDDGEFWICEACLKTCKYRKRDCDYAYCRTCHPEAAKRRDKQNNPIPGFQVGTTMCHLQ